jgi:hypothetical protein
VRDGVRARVCAHGVHMGFVGGADGVLRDDSGCRSYDCRLLYERHFMYNFNLEGPELVVCAKQQNIQKHDLSSKSP